MKVDARRVRPQAHRLHDGAVAVFPRDAKCGTMRTMLGDFDCTLGKDLLARAAIVFIDVPGIVFARLIAISPKLVSAIRKDVATDALIEEAVDGSIFAELDA